MLQVSMQRPLFGYLGLLVKHNALQSSCYLFSPLAKIFPEYQVIRTKKYFTDFTDLGHLFFSYINIK